MEHSEFHHFKQLMGAVHQKTFHAPLKKLTEATANIIANDIYEKNGLTIGTKSLILFSKAVLNDTPDKINPSLANRDTLARYLLNIPPIKDVIRKEQSNYIYWYKFCQENRLHTNVEQAFVGLNTETVPSQESPILTENRPKRRKALYFTLLLLPVIGLVWWLLPEKPTDYKQYFDFSTPEKLIDSLKEEGWIIVDEDSTFLYKQEKPGFLTLYTLAGDYWVKPNEKPIIKNLLVKKINCGACCEITLGIKTPFYTQRYQQVALLIFGKDFGPNTSHLRYLLDRIDIEDGKTVVFDNIPAIILNITENKGKELYNFYPFRYFDDLFPRDIIFLKVVYTEGKYTFNVFMDYEWSTIKEFYNASDLKLKPEYVGMAAFHGLTYDDYTPLHADTLAAYIDCIKIEPCP